jgi:CRISPR-associated protein Csm1
MNNSLEWNEHANLAALLHNIGKWIYRTKEFSTQETFDHLTDRFITEHLSQTYAYQDSFREVLNLVKNQNSYSLALNKMLAKEEAFSSERERFTPILSIFQNIFRKVSLEGQKFPRDYDPKKIYFYPIKPLDPIQIMPSVDDKSSLFSQWKIDKKKAIREHNELYEKFLKEWKLLANLPSKLAFQYSLYYLLYKYGSSISFASIENYEDISWFDYTRVLAALVNCVSYHFKPDELNHFLQQAESPHFLLLKGDLAGIQKFIYSDISLDVAGSSQGLAKRLRGRSFYVSLLTDFIASLYLRVLKLPEANLIYSGGGHFLILTPYHPEILEQFLALEKRVNIFLKKTLHARLSFILGYASFDISFIDDISGAIQQVNHQLNKAKFQKYQGYLEEIIYEEPQSFDWEEDEILGKLLPTAQFLVEVITDHHDALEKFKEKIAFREFDTFYFVFEKEKEIKEFLVQLQNAKFVKILTLNSTQFLDVSSRMGKDYPFPIAYGFRLVANYAPKDQAQNISTFEDLSRMNFQEKQDLSFPQLGVLRLDLDNLGAIFAMGLQKHDSKEKGKEVSFAKMATLSRQLNLFFTGYTNELAKKFGVYVTYSGGDDAFFIGSWFNIVHFASEFEKEFKKFTCDNPNFSLSAGILVCSNRHPIAKLAEHAANFEELSKSYQSQWSSKNAVTIFENTLHWKEYHEMINFAVVLLKHTKKTDDESTSTENPKLARSLLHRLLRTIKASLYSKGPLQGEVDMEKLHSNFAKIHYLFARHGFNNHRIENAKDELTKQVIKVILDNFSPKRELVKNYIIPMYYVLLKTRTVEK